MHGQGGHPMTRTRINPDTIARRLDEHAEDILTVLHGHAPTETLWLTRQNLRTIAAELRGEGS